MRWDEYAANLFGIDLDERQLAAFELYAAELQEWNQRFNLTSVSDRSRIEIMHFLDSLSCLTVMRPAARDRIVDIGTGAGFPGLPIRIACPQVHLTVVESIGKKAEFCQYIVDRLGLTNVKVIHMRAEDFGGQSENRETYHWALARAVAMLPTLLEYLLPLLKMEGKAISQKGDSALVEVQSAKSALEILGGELDEIIPVELPSVAETRHLIVISKLAATPLKYPRRTGVPRKRPLM